LKKALELQKESRLAYFDLGSIYADQGRNQEALLALQRAVTLDPTQPDAHYRLARLYSALGQKEKASREFAKTKELHSKKEESLIQKVSGEDRPPR
jgi:Tfp pilus assembly protein PilF